MIDSTSCTETGRTPEQIEELRDRVNSRPWFHIIPLGDGINTPGVDKCMKKLPHYGLPDRLDGQSVLDVGAYDGFWTFECERRGAQRSVAADHYCWTKSGRKSKEGFDMAREALNSKAESIVVRIEDMNPDDHGTFDLVLFLGVLYHAQDPLHYLRIMRSLCRGKLILETHVDLLDYPRPAAAYYPGKTLNNDPSCFFGPNPACVIGMLEDVGFRNAVHFSTFNNNERAVFHAEV